MPSCDSCGTTIIFGGKKEGGYRFCNDTCLARGQSLLVADQIPDDVVDELAAQFHSGDCPKCGGPGPVDVQTSHTIWSALITTSWKSNPEICCRSCGTKKRLGALVSSFLLGWWGFPWGIIFTPIQIAKNVIGLVSRRDMTAPSDKLRKMIRVDLASRIGAEDALPRAEDAEA